MSNSSLRAFLVVVLAVALAGSSSAQVDLPHKTGKPGEQKTGEKQGEGKGEEGKGKKETPARPAAEHYLVCTICFERNYTTPVDPKDEDGLQQAYCAVCRKTTTHKQSAALRKDAGGLDLPVQKTEEPATSATGQAVGQPDSTEARVGVARTYFESLQRSEHVEPRIVDQAVESLVLLGAEGSSAARMALLDDNPAVFTTALRVLLRSRDGSDHDLVVDRLRSRMPSQVAGDAVDELVRVDPVRATPSLLIALLEHQQAPVRTAAETHLQERLGPDLLPSLTAALRARMPDARLRALNLAVRIDDPTVLEILLDRIADSSASVAWRAVTALAERDDPRVETELLALAFRERWILRTNAYALLALIEREDRRLTPLLNEGHVETLLGGLESNDPFVAGTCAAALAGIGFRSSSLRESTWLDREVPDRLVATVAGHVYFNDFSSLRGPAQRRLKDIAGFDFGSDGPKWAEWWIDARDDFRASRATLLVAAGDERTLEVSFRSGGSEATVFQLFGPDRTEPRATPTVGETIYLTQGEAGEFVDLMRREGMLSVNCLPGQRGTASPAGRWLEIRIAGQSKSFAFAPDLGEPWFERAVGMARALRERNLWQRFPDPAVHGDRLGLWKAQSEWWATETDEHARSIALRNLLLVHLAAVPASEWEPGIAELERLAKEPGVLDETTFDPILKLLDSERFFTERAERLLALVERAGALDGATLDAAGLERSDRVIDLLVRRFDVDASEPVAVLLTRAGHERTRAAARDARWLLRAIATTVLAHEPTEEDIPVILELLRDPNEDVEIAAVMALGEHRVEAGRTELLVRARLGTPRVRAAALRAIGVLGGESVLDALTVALTDPDPDLKLAAASGMASLDDARATPMLVSLLRQGRDAPWYDAVRAGLLRQGPAAEEALLSMLRAPGLDMQREGALLLSYRGVPAAVPSLLRVLDADPTDRPVAEELAVITCVDHRAAKEPAAAWIAWWGGVVHDDSLAWFRAALVQQGLGSPGPEEFVPPGSREIVTLLIDVMGRAPDYLAERARRELGRLLERDLGPMPPVGEERTAWLAALAEHALRSRD
jgi:HEAT repeat protein/ribosomal protein L33